MAIYASDIKDEASFKAWLNNQSEDAARVIAARSALRVLPSSLSINQVKHSKLSVRIQLDVILCAFQANFLAWVSRKYSSQNLIAAAVVAADAANNAAYAAFDAVNYTVAAADVSAPKAAVYIAAMAAEDPSFNSAASRACNAVSNFRVAAAANAASAADAGNVAVLSAAYARVSVDAEWLEINPKNINGLINQSLWLELLEVPENYFDFQKLLKEKFDTFRQSDLAQNTSFGLIADWYAALLPEKGKPRSLFGEKKDLELAMQPKAFWQGEAQEVMDRVAELVGWPEGYRKQDDQYEDNRNEGEALILREETPEIPPMKPAAIMPEWRDGKLSLPLEPIENDFSASDMDQVLSALKKELQSFASDIGKSNNIDRRIVEYISKLAEEAPETVPTQEEFFRFAHKEEVLRGLVDQASQEWDSMLAAKFHGLTRLYSQTVQKFPPWREFIKVKYSEIQTHEDLEKVKELEATFSENLQDELTEEFINPQLPEALSALKNDIPDVKSITANENSLHRPIQRQAYDVLESINNTLKALYSRLFEGMTIASEAQKQSIDHDEVIKYEQFKKKSKKFFTVLKKCGVNWMAFKIFDWLWQLINPIFGL